MKRAWFRVFLLIAMSPAVLGQVPAASGEDGPRNSTPANAASVKRPTIYQVGGDVQAPKLIHSVQPKYSKEAKKKKISGYVTVNLYVDEKGLPQNVHVSQGVGYGLDEEALFAVQKYRFEPATKDHVPVAVELNVQVNFLMM